MKVIYADSGLGGLTMVLICGIVIGAIGAGFALWLGKRALTELKARWDYAVKDEAMKQVYGKVCDKCGYYEYETGNLTHPPISKCDFLGIEIRHKGAQSCTRWRAKE